METMRQLGVKKIAVGLSKTTVVFTDGVTIQVNENLDCEVRKGKEKLFVGCALDDSRPEDLSGVMDKATAIRASIQKALKYVK